MTATFYIKRTESLSAEDQERRSAEANAEGASLLVMDARRVFVLWATVATMIMLELGFVRGQRSEPANTTASDFGDALILTDDQGNLQLQSGANGSVLIGEVDFNEVVAQVQALQRELAATRACTAQGKILVGDTCVPPGLGQHAFSPASSCQQLKELGLPTNVYFTGTSAPASQVFCDMSTTPATSNGSGDSSEAPARSCKAVKTFFCKWNKMDIKKRF
ncbi:hypothetical protein PTSG_08978 [Salpingoeca rosetta]|uniref:Uncharacterized protein n=1 Tax=Salpingoeca rosetta (strain ATCC 50818 / BSB-021) TaxID=946362 RepID=F2ULV1_SALR5|nr:uncharacterized protein PTSG_08978 [Salpingoeca rosetta]EGD78100.1 hypothetical protein PTSG_08978 [Salpingoeca rosetta]|eukprot:XP_004989776.1 hypothetical protein PTSG_08978 [Salpingoeca rosetta]